VYRFMAKRTLLFDIFGLTMLAGYVLYRAVPRGWFAIWFANSRCGACPLLRVRRTSLIH
jgi:hypothetical protein